MNLGQVNELRSVQLIVFRHQSDCCSGTAVYGASSSLTRTKSASKLLIWAKFSGLLYRESEIPQTNFRNPGGNRHSTDLGRKSERDHLLAVANQQDIAD